MTSSWFSGLRRARESCLERASVAALGSSLGSRSSQDGDWTEVPNARFHQRTCNGKLEDLTIGSCGGEDLQCFWNDAVHPHFHLMVCPSCACA